MLSLYKMNVLHWHLTEDQGWRIAIDKYPRLAEVAAYRTEKDSSVYGGIYSKEDIREIVAYASQKNIDIIPEIEMPGHSQAAIAAYPHLSCTGNEIEVANDWGVFKDIYCAGNDSVFIFLEDVLTEVIDLFPSKYIHIGGDEAPKSRWEKCNRCQKRIADNELAGEEGLQSYFIKRVQAFLKTKNREIIGWDEILEGGLAEGAVVQSWRGMEGGVEAVKHGNRAIMSPTSHAYLDYALGSIDLEKIYSFNPIPAELTDKEARLIIGGECNMWTEHVPDEETLDNKVFPRMLGMAEGLWSGSEEKSYAEFLERVYVHHDILDDMAVDCGYETIPFEYDITRTGKEINVKIKKNIASVDIESTMNEESVDLEEGITLGDLEESSFITYAINRELGIEDNVVNVHPHSSLGAKVEYPEVEDMENEYSPWYTGGGDSALTDGVLGSLDFRDGHWQGFWGTDMECVIECGHLSDSIHSIEANFYQYSNSWIFIPKSFKVGYTMDGIDWHPYGVVLSEVDPERRGKFIHNFKLEHSMESPMYIRIRVENFGKVPNWHEAAGADAWIFIDEIVVK